MPSRDWNRLGVEATVGDYLDAPASELRGESFDKATRDQAPRARLVERTHGAVAGQAR